jgi:peptidoglycan/xylan/chitin deacetylase (PgdA/CDA1 family)
VSSRKLLLSPLAVLIMLSLASLPPPAAGASVSVAAPNGGVVFTFSNGLASHTTAASVLEAHGLAGTFYVGSGTLRQGPFYTAYLSASDVANLSTRGHDVESMTVDQQDLTTLTAAQVQQELANSQAAIQNITGKPARQLAYPFGAVNDDVAAATATYYASGRTVDGSPQSFLGAIDAYHVPAILVTQATSLATAEGYVDFAAANHVFVVLAFGGIVANPGTYDWTPGDLDALAAYAVSKGVAVETIAQLVAGAPPPPPSAPAAPALSATAGNGVVNLSWSQPANGGSAITGYRLYRGASSGAETLYRTLPPQTAFRDVNVTNSQPLFYQVSAVNAIGEGDRSNEVAATPQAVPSGARIVFTFDDGYASGTTAASILESHGFHGTFYASSGLLRMGTAWTDYMSPSDLQGLAMRGHEVGSMAVDQQDLTKLTSAQVASELSDSQSALQGIVGQPVRSLAYPFGAVNANVSSAAASRYDSGRTITGNVNDFAAPPVDAFHRPGLIVQSATSLATAQGDVDFAIARNVPVVLEFSRIVPTPGTYDWTPANLDALAAYVQAKGVPVVTMAQLVAGSPLAPPAAPRAPALSDIPRNALVSLAWSAPDNDGSAITGYRVYKGASSGNETLYQTLGGNATGYNDTGVVNGQMYFYQVSAVNAIGEGPRSNEVVAMPNAAGVPPGATVVITFDDGLRSQLSATSVLDKYGFKATYFINAGNLRDDPSCPGGNCNNPESMTASELKGLVADGQDVESHLLFHDDATTLSASALDNELRTNQQMLRDITGQPVNELAWPFGAHNASTDAAAAKYYRTARTYNSDLTVATAHTTNRYGVPAMGILSSDSAAKVEGYADYAITHNVTVILVIHNLAPVPRQYGVALDQYDWNLAAFKSLVDYLAARQVPVRTVAQMDAAGRMPPD